MREITALIADDEPPQRALLRRQLGQFWPELSIISEAENGIEALELIEARRPDLAFLDIRMPGLSGLEVARRLETETLLVFVTAYDEFAIKAFECEAVDYLLKPLDRLRFEKTVERLQQRLAAGAAAGDRLKGLLAQLESHSAPRYLKWIRASQGEQLQLIAVERVIYFSAGDKYTTVYTESGEALIKRSLKLLEQELDPDQFWRVHRGVIINVNYLQSAQRELGGRYRLSLMGCRQPLTVSRAYAHLFKQM